MKNKKIFFLADAKSIHTVKWVDYFVEKGYLVYLATFALTNNTRCKNIFFLSNKDSKVAGGNYHYFLSIDKLTNILKDVKPDIINAHYSYSMGLIGLIAKKKSKINSKFSVVCHGSDILAPPKLIIYDLINKYVLKHCDKIFVVSDQIKDKIANFGINLNNIFVGQYGIDIKNTIDCKKDIDILSNRNYTPNSQINLLLEFLKAFEKKNLNIVFVLPQIDSETLNKFKVLYPFINFYPNVPYENMIEMISRTKIYISATKSDGTSLSLIEAMSKGAIPIVSNIVSNRSWILDGLNGYLFDTKEKFVQSIQMLNTENITNMQNMNKNIIDQKCTYTKQMKKIEEFLLS